ncbi:hypothetical protein BD414DRAFT_483529 [Trametes punicea]|nr:hypothetical protein BD414DRAFT_483529 [Trametes punicea]
MTGHLLPHALLEFTLARASARLEALAYNAVHKHGAVHARRYAHHQAVPRDTFDTYVAYKATDDRSFYTRRESSKKSRSVLETGGLFPYSQDGPLTELERRIMDLKEAPSAEDGVFKESIYSDSELTSMYEELLATPSMTQTQNTTLADPEARQQEDAVTLRGVVQDLYELEDSTIIPTDTRSQYCAAIAKLSEIVGVLNSARSSATGPPLSISILSEQQWLSLIRSCVREEDGKAAESVIDLIKRSGTDVPEDGLNIVLSLYADRGDVAHTERFITSFVGSSPTDRQRDLHIKAHLKSIAPRTFPTSALNTLHAYEERGAPAPQRAYTRVINALLSVRSAMAEAQAWDLFTHMRYVAHPTPDAYLYTMMMAACASRVLEPQPARALDLWTEMTTDKAIPPTAAAYTAVIYACARSGEKTYVNEAFRLAKEMLDGHRDAYGNTAFRPDRKTFCALLEGAKRIGDLAKVRWILAEIVSVSLQAARGDVVGPVTVDEEIMTHVFHAYAAYKPPFNRAATVVVDQPIGEPHPSNDAATALSPSGTRGEPHADLHSEVPVPSRHPQFTTILPQSRGEVLGETRSLFHRILRDVAPSVSGMLFTDHATPASMPEAFENVRLTPRLLNAYLSMHYVHGLFDEGSHLYRKLFSELGIEKNAWSYVEALERSARARRGPERKQALQFAREVWQEWQPVEEAWRWRQPHAVGVDARMVERAYTAMIRILSLTGHLREAVQLVRTFVERYPPDVIKQANPKPALRSTRVALQAPRPLVRLFTPVEVPDDTVPPLLSFPEVELLHHRLVTVGDEKNIRYLKWVCMAYAGALRRRQEATLRAEPVSDTGSTAMQA